VGCSVRCIQLHGDIEFLQIAVKRWADDSPFELAITAAQRRHGQGCDTPSLVVREQKFESIDDVTDVCNLSPMVLGRFRNNELLTVSGIRERAITVENGEIVSRGALHVDQGIAVTSHASQGKTVDQVIVSVPVEAFSQTNEAQFYVSMSRARKAMQLVTDSKAAQREAVCRPSKRLSPWELIHEANQERALQASMEMQRAAAVGRNSEKEMGYER
jgi:hypothetical protein